MPPPAKRADWQAPQWSRPASLVHLRRAAELAGRRHQRVVQQPAVLQVFEQRREPLIERRQAHRAAEQIVTRLRTVDAEPEWLSHTFDTMPFGKMYIHEIVTSPTPASTSRRASRKLSPYSLRP